jgi:CheY-like chemotaxis protein
MDTRVGALVGLHILVVEDDPDARQILSMVLTYFGAMVSAASSAEEALKFMRQAKPDLVVADFNLPKHNADWLVRRARHHGLTALPFLAVSAQDADARDLEELGFEGYLRKPVDHVQLVDTILALARRV